MIYLGIDPGKSGGLAIIDVDTVFIGTFKFADSTEADLWRWLTDIHGLALARAVIEKVSSSPQMGVTSAFTFGRSYGFLRGMLTAACVPFAEVSPQKWQKAMGCMTKGDKNVSKAAAQRLYPNEKITHSVADALLLATYCRRHHAELF